MRHLLFLFILTFFMADLFASDILWGKGEAYDQNGKVVYVENHQYKRSPSGEILEVKTSYSYPDGRVFAELQSDFSKDPYVPDTLFIDHRFNEKRELSYDKEKKLINMKMTNVKTGEIKVNTLEKNDNMVSGQGIHNYVLHHYNLENREVKFVVLSKMDAYSFHMEKVKSLQEGHTAFALQLSNWVLRAIFKGINVVYRDKDRALLSFNGITHIESDTRALQFLTIKMSYPGE